MLLDLIKNRKSVRDYQEKEIPKQDLIKILEAGYLAPSWMNVQSWKFILVQNQETKELLSELAGNQPHVKKAPAVIVCVADKNAWSKDEFSKVLADKGIQETGIEKILSIPSLYPPLSGDEITLLRTVEQVTYATAYMMLTAKDLGIDSCIIGAIQNETTSITNQDLVENVNRTLNLGKDDVLISMITLGYAKDNEPANKQRKEFNKIVHSEKVGNPIY